MTITATIRAMSPADVEPASDMIVRGGWGDRRAFFAFAAAHAECSPIVAEVAGEIVGTGVGTRNGSVGWVGTIFVSPDHRRRGLGRALTAEIVDRLEAAGCRSLVLVATEAGRPIYEQLGFEVQTWYHTMQARGVDRPPDPLVRRLEPADLREAAAMDQAATGEDRAHLLEAFLAAGTGWVLRDPDRPLRGFVLRAPWGGGATIAADPTDALIILEHRRAVAGPDRDVKSGLLEENVEGLARLSATGWTEAWRALRMIRGEPLDWRPEAIWGQFNHALG